MTDNQQAINTFGKDYGFELEGITSKLINGQEYNVYMVKVLSFTEE